MAATTDLAGIRDATVAAIGFVKELLTDGNVSDFRLEEFQESEDGRSWLLTIGFLRDEAKQPVPWLAAVPTRIRAQKVVVVNKSTGTPVAMKNREGD